MTIANKEAAMLHRLAQQDRLAFLALCADQNIELRITCFHGQQAIEKLFKAVLVARGHTFPPTHNLMKLAQLLEENEILLPVPLDALERINPYAVAFRYDDRDIHTVTRAEARATVDAVCEWASSLLVA